MSRASLAADLLRLKASNHYLMTRTSARDAGLCVFHGPTCPVRGHGNVRMMVGSRCADCIEAADNIRKEAKKAGREAALKAARAELARDLKATEVARLKAQAEALKAQQKADDLKALKAMERSRKRAERQVTQAPQVAPVVPAVAPLDDEDDDRLPWE